MPININNVITMWLKEDKPAPPNSKQSQYNFLGNRYYSLREMGKQLSMGNQSTHNYVKSGRVYYVLINNRPFIPDWSLLYEKHKYSDAIPEISVVVQTPTDFTCETSCSSSCDTFNRKPQNITFTVLGKEDLLNILETYDYTANVMKTEKPAKKFIAENIGLKYEKKDIFLYGIFREPSNDVEEILVYPPKYIFSYPLITVEEKVTTKDGKIGEFVGDTKFREVITHDFDTVENTIEIMSKDKWEEMKNTFQIRSI